MSITNLPIFAFVGCILAAAVSDARTLRISNQVSVAILALFAVHALCSLTSAQTATALGLAAVTLIIGFAAYTRGWIGGGDVKLLAASMAWAGWSHVAEFLIVTGLAGGVIAVALRSPLMAIAAGALRRDWPGTASEQHASMPYGVAIAAGAIAVAVELLPR